MNKALRITLAIVLGGVYLFSAYSKLMPVEPFEYTFVDIGIAGWKMAPFMARIVIGIELVLGLLYILQLGVRSFTSKFSIGLLSFFTIYLLILVIRNGNNSNCGCFGELLPMTPMESIIKNIVLIGLSWLLLKKGFEIDYRRGRKWMIAAVVLSGLAFPYIRNPIDLGYSQSYLQAKQDTYFMPLDTLINRATVNKVPENLKQGKHVIAFFSSVCPHCKVAAIKLRIMKEKNPDLPLYFVINGTDEEIKAFHEYTKSGDIPWTRLNGKSFMYLVGISWPKIVFINNQQVEQEPDYFALDQEQLEEWLKK